MTSKRELAGEVAERLWLSDEDVIVLDDQGTQQVELLRPGSSRLTIDDVWEEIRGIVVQILRDKIDAAIRERLTPNYEFVDPRSRERLARPPMYTTTKWRERVREAVHVLGWQDFEDLVACSLHHYGAKEYGIVRRCRSKEGGLDAWARLPLADCSRIEEINHLNLVVLAQVKQTAIDWGEVLKFVQQIEDVRSEKHPLSMQLAPHLERQVGIIPAMFTARNFTNGAVQRAREEGIIIRSGNQLAEDLLRFGSLVVPSGEDAGAALRGWLASHKVSFLMD